MTIKQIIGLLLVLSPFIGLAVLCFKTCGWEGFVFVFGGSVALFLILSLGIHLLQ